MSDPECSNIVDLAGNEIDARIVTAAKKRRRLVVCAYHNGKGTGQPPGERTAYLSLEMNGMVLGTHEDRAFDSYNLSVRKIVVLEMGATASFLIRWFNNKAETSRHGILVLDTDVSMEAPSVRVEPESSN